MYLVQILLPLYDNDGGAFGRELFDRVNSELTEKFGGATAHVRAPAEGSWKEGGEVVRDRVILIEVMAETLDSTWWRRYRRDLEHRFHQEEIMVRALSCERV